MLHQRTSLSMMTIGESTKGGHPYRPAKSPALLRKHKIKPKNLRVGKHRAERATPSPIFDDAYRAICRKNDAYTAATAATKTVFRKCSGFVAALKRRKIMKRASANRQPPPRFRKGGPPIRVPRRRGARNSSPAVKTRSQKPPAAPNGAAGLTCGCRRSGPESPQFLIRSGTPGASPMTDEEIAALFAPQYDLTRKPDALNQATTSCSTTLRSMCLKKIIKHDELWFSNPLFMNDLQEMWGGDARRIKRVSSGTPRTRRSQP